VVEGQEGKGFSTRFSHPGPMLTGSLQGSPGLGFSLFRIYNDGTTACMSPTEVCCPEKHSAQPEMCGPRAGLDISPSSSSLHRSFRGVIVDTLLQGWVTPVGTFLACVRPRRLATEGRLKLSAVFGSPRHEMQPTSSPMWFCLERERAQVDAGCLHM
jgi:hypothetical protein